MSRDIVLRAVEAADGWQFVPSHSFVKIPGLTEPADIMRIGPVVMSGLADQLIFQIDQSDDFTFHWDENGKVTITHKDPEKGKTVLYSYSGESRALNALCAMSKARFF